MYRILHHKLVLLEKQINRFENFFISFKSKSRRKENADKFERRKKQRSIKTKKEITNSVSGES